MKASEAKTKVCPFISNILPAEDDGFQYGWKVNCICGDCMAWEYTKKYLYKDLNEKNKQNIKDYEKKGFEWFDGCEWRKELDESEKEGYCKRLGQ